MYSIFRIFGVADHNKEEEVETPFANNTYKR